MDNQEQSKVEEAVVEDVQETVEQEVTEQPQSFTEVKPEPRVIGFFTQHVDDTLFNEIKSKPAGMEHAQEYGRRAIIITLFNNIAGVCEERQIKPTIEHELDDFLDVERFDTIVRPHLLANGLVYSQRLGRDQQTGNVITNYEVETFIDSNNNPLSLTKVTFISPDLAIAVLSTLYAQVANHTHRVGSLAHAFINEYMHVHYCDTFEDLLAAREVYEYEAEKALERLADAQEGEQQNEQEAPTQGSTH